MLFSDGIPEMRARDSQPRCYSQCVTQRGYPNLRQRRFTRAAFRMPSRQSRTPCQTKNRHKYCPNILETVVSSMLG
jgi:hypothetical protein